MNQCDDRKEKYRVCAHRLPFPSHGLWAVVYCPTLRHLPPPTPFHWSSESVPFCFCVISSSRFFLSCFWMLKRCLCALVEGCTHHLCISSCVWYQIKIDLRQIWSSLFFSKLYVLWSCFYPNCACCEKACVLWSCTCCEAELCFLQTVRVVLNSWFVTCHLTVILKCNCNI